MAPGRMGVPPCRAVGSHRGARRPLRSGRPVRTSWRAVPGAWTTWRPAPGGGTRLGAAPARGRSAAGRTLSPAPPAGHPAGRTLSPAGHPAGRTLSPAGHPAGRTRSPAPPAGQPAGQTFSPARRVGAPAGRLPGLASPSGRRAARTRLRAAGADERQPRPLRDGDGRATAARPWIRPLPPQPGWRTPAPFRRAASGGRRGRPAGAGRP
jgi:hypothetical protein